MLSVLCGISELRALAFEKAKRVPFGCRKKRGCLNILVSALESAREWGLREPGTRLVNGDLP